MKLFPGDIYHIDSIAKIYPVVIIIGGDRYIANHKFGQTYLLATDTEHGQTISIISREEFCQKLLEVPS